MFKKLLAGFIVMAVALTGMPVTSYAGVQIGDNLQLFGDVRIRLEWDTRDPGTGVGLRDDNRERMRIRTRFGVNYQTAFEPLSLGFRLTTGTSLWSPHQTVDLTTTNMDNRAAGIDLDRAFLKFKFLETGTAVLGKQAYPFWQQTEQMFDADISPPGYAAVYTADLGDQGKLTFGAAYFYLINNGWEENMYENDAILGWQVLYQGEMGNISPTLAVTSLTTTDPNSDNNLLPASLRDDENSFYQVAAGLKVKLDAVTLRAGFDYHFSDVSTISGDDRDQGYVGQVRARMGQYGVRYYYYNIEENSVPSIQGLPLSQDNFPSASVAPVGFEGHRIQFDYKVAKGVSADFRIYLLKYKKDNAWGEMDDRNRYQLNLNAKF